MAGWRRVGPVCRRGVLRNGTAHGRSRHLPAGARSGVRRSRAGSSIRPQRRPATSVP